MNRDEALALCEGEHRRQVAGEGYDDGHDDVHVDGEILTAAVIYLWHGTDMAAPMSGAVPLGWPWTADAWKPRDRQANLVRAGGLCIAERQRLDRAGRALAHAQHKLDLVVREMMALDDTAAVA